MIEHPSSDPMIAKATHYLSEEQRAGMLPTIMAHADDATKRYPEGLPHGFNEAGVGLFLCVTTSNNRSFFIPAAAYFEKAFDLASPDEVTTTAYAGNFINSIASFLEEGSVPVAEMQWITDRKDKLEKARTCIENHAQELAIKQAQASNIINLIGSIGSI